MQPSLTSWSLSLAGLAVSLRCPDVRLDQALRRRYAGFMVSGAIGLNAIVALAAPGWRAPVGPALVARGELAELSGPGLAASVDLAAHRAELRVEPAHALEAIDYFLRVACALLAFEAGGLMLHAAGLVRAERAYLFLGPSGAGKSTVARNAVGARVLSDDLVVLMPNPQGWQVHATPFSNPDQLAPVEPAQAPLAAFYRLVQAPFVALRPVGRAQATATIAASAPVLGLDPERGAPLLRRAAALAAGVPLADLYLLPDPSFWAVIDPPPVPCL